MPFKYANKQCIRTEIVSPGNPNLRGRISMVDILVLTSLDLLLCILKLYIFFFCKTIYLNGEVNCTEPSPSVSFPRSHIYYRAAWVKDM